MKPQLILLLFILFFLFLFPVSLLAETSRKAVTLDTVIVTATKPKDAFQTGDVDVEQTPAFFSVIEKEEFEGKMEDLSEVLEKEAGIQVRQSGGLGSFSTVSLRGSSSDQVIVFLDGILLNSASGGGVDLGNISLADIEAIEIYRGVTPINFGKASIGGVVNIKTLRSKEGLNVNASVGYGSFNTRKLSGFINHKPDKWDYLISADYLGSDNDFEFLNDNGTEWNKDDDSWEKRNNAQFDQENLLTKFGFDFTDDVRIDFVNQWFSKDQGLPSWNNGENTKTTFNTKRNISTIKLTVNDVGPYHFNTSTGIDYSWKEEDYDDTEGHVGLGDQHSIYTTTCYGLNSFLEWLTEWNVLSFILDAQHEEYDVDDLLNSTNPRESSRDSFSLGLQDTLLFFKERVIVTPALRYTIIEDELRSAVSSLGVPLEAVSRDEDYLCPQIGLKYCILDWLTLKTNLAKYVREPSFFELFGDRGFFMGNEDLKEEEGANFDAGFEIKWMMSEKWLDRISFNIAYFRSEVDNLISVSYDARGIGKYDNISEARIEGVETGINLEFLEYFRFVGNATWQDPENRSEIGAFNGKQLSGRSEKSYLGRIEAMYGRFKVYSEYVVEKEMYYDTANLLKAKDKEKVNASILWLFRSFLFGFEAKNLGDDHYEDFNGYPSPGRSYFFTIKHSL
jgi:iron complex outermembrane receptor protein